MSRSVFTSWWFGHALLLAMCSALLLAAIVLRPDPDVLTLFGYEVPILCGFRRLFGVPCPGCGLSRSFVFLAHGQVLEAFRANWMGPPLFLLVASQVPYRAWRLLRRGG